MKAMKFKPDLIHGLLYAVLTHAAALAVTLCSLLLLPTAWDISLPVLTGAVCILSLPLFIWWFWNNTRPRCYLGMAFLGHILCGGIGLVTFFPLLNTLDGFAQWLLSVLPYDVGVKSSWEIVAVWVYDILGFGILLAVLCLGLLIFDIIRWKRHLAKPSTERSESSHEEST